MLHGPRITPHYRLDGRRHFSRNACRHSQRIKYIIIGRRHRQGLGRPGGIGGKPRGAAEDVAAATRRRFELIAPIFPPVRFDGKPSATYSRIDRSSTTPTTPFKARDARATSRGPGRRQHLTARIMRYRRAIFAIAAQAAPCRHHQFNAGDMYIAIKCRFA